MRILFVIFILICNALLSVVTLEAQKTPSPLEPKAPNKQTEVGLFFGLGDNYQTGLYDSELYDPKCKHCELVNGNKAGINIGLLFERDFNKYLQWGFSIQYFTKSIDASSFLVERVPIEYDTINNLSEDRDIPFRYHAALDIGLLSLQPYLKWTPHPFVFLRLGFGSSLVTNQHIVRSKELLKFLDTLSNGQIVDVVVDGDNPVEKEVENGEIPKMNPIQFSVEPSLGFNINISQQMYLSPIFQYSIPLTQLNSLQKDFKINQWRILLEFRMALILRD